MYSFHTDFSRLFLGLFGGALALAQLPVLWIHLVLSSVVLGEMLDGNMLQETVAFLFIVLGLDQINLVNDTLGHDGTNKGPDLVHKGWWVARKNRFQELRIDVLKERIHR